MNCLLVSLRRRQRVDAIADHSASAPTVSADKKGKGNLNFQQCREEKKKLLTSAENPLFFSTTQVSLRERWRVCIGEWQDLWSRQCEMFARVCRLGLSAPDRRTWRSHKHRMCLWRSGRHLTLAWSRLDRYCRCRPHDDLAQGTAMSADVKESQLALSLRFSEGNVTRSYFYYGKIHFIKIH